MTCYRFHLKKNPAYRRHLISGPMLKEAPTPKKNMQGFFFFFGGFGWAGVGSCAVYSRAMVYIFIYEALQDMGTILWPLSCCFWTYEIAYFFFKRAFS